MDCGLLGGVTVAQDGAAGEETALADELTTAKEILSELRQAELPEQAWDEVRRVLDDLAAASDPLKPAEITKVIGLARLSGRAGKIDAPVKMGVPEPLVRRIAELVHRIGGLGDPPTWSMPMQPGSPDHVARA
jgi:hypothetical protein